MTRLKKSLLTFLMVVFLVHTADAMAACGCSEMSSEVTDQTSHSMPCHKMDNQDQSNAEKSKDAKDRIQANCEECGCGHCKAPSQISLLSSPAVFPLMVRGDLQLTSAEMILSGIIFGIENPPKLIS